jgi:addiction module RelE/StbE family toxin
MSKEVLFSKKFTKQYKKLSPAMQSRFAAQLALWAREPMNRKLNHHVLVGELAGFHSINVGGDLRALYREYGNGIVIFEKIGTHSQLYG